ncbi:MAG: glycosyltransferase, partial [Isosphaeraceae bacterium]
EVVLAQRPVAAVLSTSPPVGSHLVALELKRRHGLPWVADFRDPLRGNPFRTRRWFFPYDGPLERLFFRQADALIANTDTMANLWRRHHRKIDGKVSVIWNGFDPEDQFDPTPPDSGSRRVLAHVGALYGRRHPGRLLASLVRLILAGELAADRVGVKLVGPIDGDCLEVNREAVDSLRSWGCLDYDGKQVSRDDARRAGLSADYLLLLDLNEQEVDLQVPAKIFEYVRIGRPILAFTRRGSPVERILKGSGVPYRAIHHDADDATVDDAVRGIFNLPASSTRPSPWFEEQFDGRNQTRALAGILDRVRGGSPIHEASIND